MDFFKSDWGQNIIITLVPAVISIIGFAVTIYVMRKSIIAEIQKEKVNITLEKMAIIPYEVLSLYDRMVSSFMVEKTIKRLKLSEKQGKEYRDKVEISQDVLFDEMKELYNKIYAYCSKEAVLILATMQRLNYENMTSDEDIKTKYRIMAYYVLLATQIKYDATGEAVNPKLWYECRITDFSNLEETIIKENNSIVKELQLSKRFIA